MEIIAFVNQKGGVGKTTSCLNVGAALRLHEGQRVLLVDADPQGNLTASAGIDLNDADVTLLEVLKGSADINTAIKTKAATYGATEYPYDIIPADIMLSGVDIELSAEPGREFILKECFSKLEKTYDYILIDCPPALSLTTVMALTAADKAIIPVQAHFLALNGVALLYDTIQRIKRRLNPQLDVGGVIMTMYDPRKILNREVYDSLTRTFPGQIFDTTVSNSIALAEAPSTGKDIFEYKPFSKAADQYAEIAHEIKERGGINGAAHDE